MLNKGLICVPNITSIATAGNTIGASILRTPYSVEKDEMFVPVRSTALCTGHPISEILPPCHPNAKKQNSGFVINTLEC